MSKLQRLYLPLLLLFVAACEPAIYDKDGLNAFILDEGNGMVKTIQRKGYDLTLYNRPTDLWVAQELRNEQATDALISSYRDKYDDYLYFILKISKEGKEALYTSGNHGSFSEVLQNLSFRMGAFTEMVTSARDTIPLADSHYSRLYGQSESTSVMIAFNKEKIKKTEWVQINLSDLGLGTGRTTYRFDTKELLSAPQIEFNPTKLN